MVESRSVHSGAQAFEEFADQLQGLLGCFGLGKVPAVIQQHAAARSRHLSLDDHQLLGRGVVVFATLNDQQRFFDMRQLRVEIIQGKVRVQPAVAPTVKGAIDICPMVTYQAFAQWAPMPGFSGMANAIEAFGLDNHVGCQCNAAQYPWVVGGGIGEDDGCTVAVTEQDHLRQLQGIEQLPQFTRAVAGQVVQRTRQGHRARLPITLTAISDHTATADLGQTPGEVFPLVSAAKAFMQQYKCRSRWVSRTNVAIFQAQRPKVQKRLWRHVEPTFKQGCSQVTVNVTLQAAPRFA